MDDLIYIKCPFDGAVLSIKNQPGVESKNVTCPVCNHKFPFSQFKRVYKKEGIETGGSGDGETQYDTGKCLLGKLTVVGTGTSYQLMPGRNVIGRKGTKSNADFQIDLAEKRSMSREHLVIEVKKVPSKGYVHYVSLFKEKVNKTFIGEEPLLYGDCVVLNHGDIIKLPDATLKFMIPDEEATEI